jgi:hypothetical protein
MNREISSIGLPETSPFPEPEGLLGTLFMVTFCLFFFFWQEKIEK